ncbi:MAG: cupin [Desulfatitalea sp. BRH_c12]|nr:MAG: cupin [Desulfatitalea sp. BRH_c12]
MNNIFPEPIRNLPKADIPIDGLQAYLSQAANHQLVFMQFGRDVVLPEHAHAAQVGFVLEGTIELIIDGKEKIFGKGDIYYIPSGIKHSGKAYAGYSDITFFAEAARYKAIEE